MVEIVYEHIAYQKKCNTEAVLAFWDKKCLNFGRNWEKGFLTGLLSAQVVILLVSEKVYNKKNKHGEPEARICLFHSFL